MGARAAVRTVKPLFPRHQARPSHSLSSGVVRPAAGSVRAHEGLPQLHRPAPPARRPRPAPDAGHEPALVVGRAHPGPVPVGRLRRPGRPPATTPSRLLGHGGQEPARGPRRRPHLPLLPPRGARRAQARHRGRPVVPGPREPAAVGRLLLPRVRHRPGPPPVLGRPRRARRRPPQGGQRPRRAPRRRRPLLPPGLLPPGAQRRRVAGGALRRPRPPRHVADARATGLVEVDLAGTTLYARIWQAQVGRIPLYLLDTSVEENDDARPGVTDRLYGGDTEHRLRQEILLGIGGVRALDARRRARPRSSTATRATPASSASSASGGASPSGLSFDEAVESVRAGTVFTTHTPVPAGIDRFPRPLMERYFKSWADECDVGFDTPHGPRPRARRGARRPVQHGRHGPAPGRLQQRRVQAARAREPPDLRRRCGRACPPRSCPIGSVTNGVHTRTWVSPEMRDLFDRHVLPEWHLAGPDRWARIDDVGDDELWRARQQARERLVAFVRQRVRTTALARGMSEADLTWVDDAFDPDHPHHRLRPPLRPLQAGHPAAVPARPAGQAAPRRRPAHAAALRGQGPPGRRPGQGDDPPGRAVRPPARPPPPGGVPGGLRHRRGPDALPGLRRVAQHPPAAPGGVRHQRREGGPQRRPQLLDPRRLVGRDATTATTAGPSRRPRSYADQHLRDQLEAGQPVRPARAPDRPPLLRGQPGPAARAGG